MQKTVIGNWKMHGTVESAALLASEISDYVTAAALQRTKVVLCPPALHIATALENIAGSPVSVGAQDCSAEAQGAFTGDISAPMLADRGAEYVILGHSERRAYHAESDQAVAEKFTAARAAGLVPILCVGETLEEREGGITEEVVARQLDAVIAHCGIDVVGEGVIAYEPVWAIGTGKTATPEQAQEVHAFIRGRLAASSQAVADGMRILYGGSMNPKNAAELIAQADIDGGLIGGASLKADDFLAVCSAANR